MGTEQLMHAAWQLESDELADLLPQLPSHVVPDLLASLEHEDREQAEFLQFLQRLGRGR